MSAPATVEITTGAYPDMPADEYHRHDSLSSSGARRLLDCPAKFDYERRHPRAPKREFDLGHAFHALALGKGDPIQIIEHRDYLTKAAKEAKAEAYATGQTPMLRHEYDAVQEMVAALRAHRLASKLLSPERGESEVSLFAQDPETGVLLRARPDKLPYTTATRMIMPDLKTCHSASPNAITKAIYDHGYYQQAEWYLRVARLLGLADADAAFLLIFVEKVPPFVITIVEVSALALAVGKQANTNAITRYAECTRTGKWPAYSTDIELIGLPPWVERRYEKELS